MSIYDEPAIACRRPLARRTPANRKRMGCANTGVLVQPRGSAAGGHVAVRAMIEREREA